MAQGFRFVCGKCDHTIVAWNDGNPYYFESVITKTGKVKQKKKSAYHPNHELLERCVGNDAEHLCLSCKKEFMVDSQVPITTCPKCKSSKIVRNDGFERKVVSLLSRKGCSVMGITLSHECERSKLGRRAPA